MTTRLTRLTQTALLLTALVPGLAHAQTTQAPKLDESLRQSVESGCVGTRSVIVRLQSGYREGLRASLTAHGDQVKGEFPALDAVAAEVHCEDLTTLAGFSSTKSVSLNGPVGVQSEGDGSSAFPEEQAAVTAARAELAAAKANAATAQASVRAAEKTATAAQALLGTAQKAVVAANRLTGSAKTAALSAANAKVVSAQAALKAAQAVLDSARAAATTAQVVVLAAQAKLHDAQNTLALAERSREREGKAARGLKSEFFATMAAPGAVTNGQFSSTFANWFGGQYSWGSHTGDAIGLAIVDSGIEPGPDFDDRITHFYDFTYGDIRAVAPSDGFGHGTHVAGLAASEFVGVAPDARLIGLKVLDDHGRGSTDNVVRAIEFAIENKTLLGINVLNLSLGHPIFEPAATDPLVQAVEHATRAGITVVLSAGNFGIDPKTGQPGYAGIASPGNAPSGLTVGAVRTFNTVSRDDDRIAPYSSRGPSWYDGFAKPDFVAPGDNLLSVAAAGSTLRRAQEARGNSGDYMRLSGTSMAAGVASGVVALMLEANHGLTPNAVKAVLEYSAIPVKNDLGKLESPLTQGAGQIEIAGALDLAQKIVPTVGVGGSWLSSSFTPSTTIESQSYSWAQSIIWGNRRVAGAKLLSEQRPAWALNVVWGEGLGSEDDNIVWGNNFGDDDNIVWGNQFDDGDNIVWGNNIVWGGEDDNIVWGNLFDDDNIVWGNLFGEDDNIVWGNSVVWGGGLVGMTLDDDNIVWGNMLGEDDNIVWGNLDDDNIVWGNLFDDNIVWGNSLDDDDNIVWGNSLDDDDNIVWGNAEQLGNVISWSGGVVRAGNSRGRRSVKKEGVR